MSKGVYQIGELAARIGVQPESIRYYERIGLLPKARRSNAGYRVFTHEHLERVELIKKMQALGFSLVEIREMLELKFSRGHTCQNVRDHLKQKLDSIDRQIAAMRNFRKDVAQALKTCEQSLKLHAAEELCPILEVRLNQPQKQRPDWSKGAKSKRS
ncbi:MAG: heavy metal-responsive transcriptional regulator [Acidobacteria bacterium]|nr:heavy metal-responsive transcriptional regulator [Acidobacteriota bacterium]